MVARRVAVILDLLLCDAVIVLVVSLRAWLIELKFICYRTAGFHEIFIPVQMHSASSAKQVSTPLLEDSDDQCIPQLPLYTAGFAVYIELKDMASHTNFYEVIPEARWGSCVCEDLRPIIDYLQSAQGVKICAVGLENPKAPETVIVLDKKISLEDVRNNVRVSSNVFIEEETWQLRCDKHYVSISFPRFTLPSW